MKGPWKSSFVFVAAAAIALACQTEPATEQGSETSPAVDAEAVKQTIEANDEAFEQAMLAGDYATIGGFYAPDAVALVPNGPRVEGQAAIQQVFTDMAAEAPLTSFELTTQDVHVAAAGDYAYATGAYTLGGTAPDGSEWTDEGKYFEVWKNVDGSWKMVVDGWSSDNPPAGMAGEEMAH